MRLKKLFEFLLVIILITMGGIVIKLINKNIEETESTEGIEIVENMESIGNTESMKVVGRTDEEYISVLLDNKEDFDYVAEMMMQWPKRSAIDFDKDGVSSDSQEITDEMSNNQEFYEHLENLYNLNEIWFILAEDEIAFYLRELPKDYIGGFYYWENTEECDYGRAKIIDEHWTLEILPAI